MKQMWTVTMHPQSICIHHIGGITRDVVTLVDHMHRQAGIRQHPGVSGSCKSGADNKDFLHGQKAVRALTGYVRLNSTMRSAATRIVNVPAID